MQLYAANNKLPVLPDSFVQLEALTMLSVGANELMFLPEAFGRLGALQQLYASYNQLRYLPKSMHERPVYQLIVVSGNCLDRDEYLHNISGAYNVYDSDQRTDCDLPCDERHSATCATCTRSSEEGRDTVCTSCRAGHKLVDGSCVACRFDEYCPHGTVEPHAPNTSGCLVHNQTAGEPWRCLLCAVGRKSTALFEQDDCELECEPDEHCYAARDAVAVPQRCPHCLTCDNELPPAPNTSNISSLVRCATCRAGLFGSRCLNHCPEVLWCPDGMSTRVSPPLCGTCVVCANNATNATLCVLCPSGKGYDANGKCVGCTDVDPRSGVCLHTRDTSAIVLVVALSVAALLSMVFAVGLVGFLVYRSRKEDEPSHSKHELCSSSKASDSDETATESAAQTTKTDSDTATAITITTTTTSTTTTTTEPQATQASSSRANQQTRPVPPPIDLQHRQPRDRQPCQPQHRHHQRQPHQHHQHHHHHHHHDAFFSHNFVVYLPPSKAPQQRTN